MRKCIGWLLVCGFVLGSWTGHGQQAPASADSVMWADAPLEQYPEYVESVLSSASRLSQPPASVRGREVFNPPLRQSEDLASWSLVTLVVWGFAALALGWWVRERRRDRAEAVLDAQPVAQGTVDLGAIADTGFQALLYAVQTEQPSQADVKRARVGLERIRMLRQAVEDPREGMTLGPNRFPVDSLNRLEWEVARLLARRFKPAEVAEIMDVSQGYVYNIRVALRKKLALTEDEDLEMFLRTYLKTE